jgi:PAS domain S-box-containing protein
MTPDDDVSTSDPAPPLHVDDHRLATVVRLLADAVVISDAEGVITFWNDAATRLFGWPATEAVGRSLDLIIPERLRARHWAGYRRTMDTGHTDYGERLLEVPALHRDGHSLSIAFTVTLLHPSGAARPDAIVAVLRDDTERWQERRHLRAEIATLRERESVTATVTGLEARSVGSWKEVTP